MLGGVASAKYCTEKDDKFKRGVDKLDQLYEFGLKIQKAVQNKDLEAIKTMIKYPMYGKKITKSYLDNKTFDQVFTKRDRDLILEVKVECQSVGIDRGFMLGAGTIWYDYIDGPTITVLNVGSK